MFPDYIQPENAKIECLYYKDAFKVFLNDP